MVSKAALRSKIRFVIVGGVVSMIDSTKKSCFSGVIAAVSRLMRVEMRYFRHAHPLDVAHS